MFDSFLMASISACGLLEFVIFAFFRSLFFAYFLLFSAFYQFCFLKTKMYARVSLSSLDFYFFLRVESVCARVFSFGGREWCHDRRVASRRLCLGCGDRSRAQFHFGASQFRSILSTLARGTVTPSHRSCVSLPDPPRFRAESILRTRNCLKFERAINNYL